jgi:hypothetical protein
MGKEFIRREANRMVRVYIICEGSTEETFTNRLLIPYFNSKNIYLTPINLNGTVTYGRIKKDTQKLCKQDKSAWVSTFIDYYRFPKDFPAHNQHQNKSSYERAQLLEEEFQKDINESNFIAHLNIHEFEALLFSDTQAFKTVFNNQISISIDKINKQYSSPEHINDGPATAPSKRLQSIVKKYDKVRHGSLIAEAITLDNIRKKCRLFDAWLNKIEKLSIS